MISIWIYKIFSFHIFAERICDKIIKERVQYWKAFLFHSCWVQKRGCFKKNIGWEWWNELEGLHSSAWLILLHLITFGTKFFWILKANILDNSCWSNIDIYWFFFQVIYFLYYSLLCLMWKQFYIEFCWYEKCDDVSPTFLRNKGTYKP